jgi:hypothetical protein
VSGPSIHPIAAIKTLDSLTGADHAPSESNATLRAELDREALRETEYGTAGLPAPHHKPTRVPDPVARLAALLRRG